MAWRVVGTLVHRLAALLRRLARTLDDVSASAGEDKRDAAEVAVAALASRFPGAPDHWLRDIVARAAHIDFSAEPHPAHQPVSAPPSREQGASEKSKWWRPGILNRPHSPPRFLPAGHAKADGDLFQDDGRNIRATGSPASEDARAPKLSPETSLRPRLRFSEPSVARVRPNPSRTGVGAPDGRDEVERQSHVADKIEPRKVRARGPTLRVVEGRKTEQGAENAPPARVLPRPAPRPAHQPDFLQQPVRDREARAPLRILETPRATQEGASIDQAGHNPPQARRRPLADAARGDNNSGADTASARLAQAALSFAAGRVRDGSPSNSATRPRLWALEVTDENWPQLPPTPLDVADAPVGPSKLDKLRAEQDLCAWSA
jgi:hypothetical protein